MADADLAEGQAVAVSLNGRNVAVCRSGGRLYAFDNLCPHSGAPLGSGRMSDGVVSCPLHGARFDLASGECLTRRMGLAAVAVHDVRAVDGRIEVALSAAPVTQPRT
jgi:3-phenylpropionate/trans-cinnamate dioxygenase ferredoxin subunit